jgi:hypothetical protein
MDSMREALFGGQPIAHVLLAEKNATAIGFGAWRKAYDLFWSMYGGDGLGLYVIPAQRGFGIGLCIVAAICADIREHSGSRAELCETDGWQYTGRMDDPTRRLSCAHGLCFGSLRYSHRS